MSLLPHIPAHVHRVLITDHETSDGRPAIGVIYRFLANITDAATLPTMTNTSVLIGPWATTSEPWVWRADAANPDVCVGVEETSDSGCSSLNEEARKSWQSMSEEIGRRARWMSLIGLHRQIIERVSDPMHLRHIEVRTMHDDMLARMFAMGSAEISRCASILHAVEESQLNREPEFRSTLVKFLWPRADEIPDWAQRRYDEALAGGYEVLQSRFAPQEVTE